MKFGFITLEPTGKPSREEEEAITKDPYLTDISTMNSLKEEFINDHNALQALSTHGPM